MSNLQLGLICVGIAIMVGVALYNSYVTRSREPRHAKKANEAKLPMDPGLTALLTEGNAAAAPDTKEEETKDVRWDLPEATLTVPVVEGQACLWARGAAGGRGQGQRCCRCPHAGSEVARL